MSSGGAMATHMHVAYSSIVMGVGMIAGSKRKSFSISFTVRDLLVYRLVLHEAVKASLMFRKNIETV